MILTKIFIVGRSLISSKLSSTLINMAPNNKTYIIHSLTNQLKK